MTPAANTAAVTRREVAETFWHVFFRRSRYVAAVIVSGLAFHFLSMGLAIPPAQYSGVSLLAWGQSPAVIAMTLASLCVLASLSVVLSMAITHPDSPHAGMYCGLLGMSIVAIRGGTTTLMLSVFQTEGREAALYKQLGVESLLLIVVVLAVYVTTKCVYGRYFANATWARRLVHTDGQFAELVKPSVLPEGTLPVKDGKKSSPADRVMVSLGAVAVTMLVGSLMIFVVVQSQAKGQVLFGAYVAFLIAAGAAYTAFPKASYLAYWLAVPLTVALGYFLARSQGEFAIPGHASSAVGRGVPLDYIAAGVPGAIHGVYIAMKWRISTTLHEKS